MHRRALLRSLETLCMVVFFLTAYIGISFAADPSNNKYEVLNPWGEIDSEILKGISPRLDSLEGKKIGLFANYKHSAIPIAVSLKEWLGSMYPDAKINIYSSDQQKERELDTKRAETFKKWAQGNDAVILLVGS